MPCEPAPLHGHPTARRRPCICRTALDGGMATRPPPWLTGAEGRAWPIPRSPKFVPARGHRQRDAQGSQLRSPASEADTHVCAAPRPSVHSVPAAGPDRQSPIALDTVFRTGESLTHRAVQEEIHYSTVVNPCVRCCDYLEVLPGSTGPLSNLPPIRFHSRASHMTDGRFMAYITNPACSFFVSTGVTFTRPRSWDVRDSKPHRHSKRRSDATRSDRITLPRGS